MKYLGATRDAGFTLIEMIVVMAILAVLATIALPVADKMQRRTREIELRSSLREIRTALDAYKKAADEGRVARPADGSGFPQRLEDLIDGVEDQRSPNHQKLYFLRRIPRDPFADVEIRNAAETWNLRSYASSPENPEPGQDVFDIHSSSKDLALDGSEYSKW